MKKILIVYSSHDGQTHKIAQAVGNELQSQGLAVYIIEAGKIAAQNHVETYDGYIVGAPVRAGRYSRPLSKWVKSHSDLLSSKPSAFFSVCLGILEEKNPKARANVQRIATEFLDWSGWKPSMWRIFAGALMYSKYGWLTKLVMKSISKKAGGGTDTNRDYEYTNWNEVKVFANQFAQRMKQPHTQARVEESHHDQFAPISSYF